MMTLEERAERLLLKLLNRPGTDTEKREVVDEMRAKGIVKPVVASLAGDVEVEQASEYLYQHGIPAYAYSTEIPVAVLGAKYRWARGAGLIAAL